MNAPAAARHRTHIIAGERRRQRTQIQCFAHLLAAAMVLDRPDAVMLAVEAIFAADGSAVLREDRADGR